jgi:hypothetical protein
MATAFEALHRRTIRAEVNPFDKTTIVSIAPFDITETILTVQPGSFFIPKGTLEEPSLTVIGPSSWWKETDPEQPLLEIVVSSVLIGRALVEDYINSMNGVTLGTSQPGIFHVPGEYTDVKEVKKKYGHILTRMNLHQLAWYQFLIKQADSLWARSNQNPLAIDDQSRMAAKTLQIDKPWIRDFQTIQNIACVACGNPRNPQFPICTHCKMIVDKELAIKLGLAEAPKVG